MTNEKAIELLRKISDSQLDGKWGDERREALEIAVRALVSQQTVNDSQGLVNDCISRKKAIDAFEPEHNRDWYTPTIIEVLEALPPAQPERKTGKWIKLDMHAHIADHKCTSCGQECYVPTCMGEPMYTYCPNCGSRMDGEANERYDLQTGCD